MCRRKFGLISGAIWTQEGAMEREHGIGILLWEASEPISDLELKDWRRIYDTTVTLPEAAGTSSYRLLPNAKSKVQWRWLACTRLWGWCKR